MANSRVRVINKNGERLYSTGNGGKVRKLLKENKAYVVCKDPFTIKLKYEPEGFIKEREDAAKEACQ